MNEKTKGGFTRGQFETGIKHPSRIILNGLRGRIVAFTCDPRDEGTESVEEKANASLIAAAFNAATEVEDMGYDGMEAVKAVPEMVAALADVLGCIESTGQLAHMYHDNARALLARLKKGGSDG